MAYNSSKGPQTHGDVKFEGDAEDTQIDFETDLVALKTNGQQRFIVSGSAITASVVLSSSAAISASAFFAGGVALGAPAVTLYSNSGNNRILTSVNSTAINGESALTFDGSRLSATGQISASLGVSGTVGHFRTVKASSIVGGSPLDISASSVTITGSISLSGSGTISASAGFFTTLTASTSTISILTSSAATISVLTASSIVGGSPLTISASSVTITGSLTFSGSSTLSSSGGFFTTLTASSATVSALTASAVSGGSPISIYGDTITMVGGGAGSTVISAAHLSSSLNVSASAFYVKGVELAAPAVAAYTNSGDNRIITSVNSNTINGESRLTFNNSTNFLFLSGNAQITNHTPALYFSNSAGTGLGYFGYNSSDNILVQNNVTNKHIVFKANDNGSIREGFRIDGAVPEVVVNQGSDSLVDFRVESDNNTHMIFSDGANDRVGINTSIPTHTLAVSGTMQVSGSFTARTLEVTRHTFQYGGTSEIYIPFEHTGEAVNPDWENQMVAPFNGDLKRILIRPELAQNGNISASLFVGTNTVAEIDGGVRVENAIGANAAAYTTTTINFTGSNQFAAGDIVGVSIKPRLNPGKINLVLIWEYDKTSF